MNDEGTSTPPVILRQGITYDEAAKKRQKLWESIGMPQSPLYMREEDMNRDYRGRISFCLEQVAEEAQRALKFVGCPNCVVEKNYGEIAMTRLHIRIIDDVMTVFRAMARGFCYNCGYEEYWPLHHDPRPQQAAEAAAAVQFSRQNYEAIMKHRESLLMREQQEQLDKLLHTKGIPLGVAKLGMAPNEYAALLRIAGSQNLPPKGSK